MNFYFGNKAQNGKSYYFEVEVGPRPETFESYMKKVFAGAGLTSDGMIKAFDKFMGQAYFRYMVNNAKSNAEVANAIQNPNGQMIKITVHVYPAIVEALKRFGINFSINNKGKATFKGYDVEFKRNVKKFQNFKSVPETPIAKWSNFDKLGAVIRRAAILLPENVGKELLALLDPTALAIVVAVVVVWAASHFVGIGEIIDVVLLIVGVISIGPLAWKAGEHLISFAIGTINAKKEEDLDEAAKHLSEAVAMLGVQVVMALLLKKAPKVLKENPEYPTFKVKDLPDIKRPAGEWFYKPGTQAANNLNPGVLGNTSIYGDIKYLSKLTGNLKNETILHERVHSFLTPKLYPLRNLRITLNWNGYAKSYLLRYLEEAIAETVAQVGTYGFKNVVVGIKFPVKEQYVTLAAMGLEVKGIFLGPVNVSGMSYKAYLTFEDK